MVTVYIQAALRRCADLTFNQVRSSLSGISDLASKKHQLSDSLFDHVCLSNSYSILVLQEAELLEKLDLYNFPLDAILNTPDWVT